MLHGQTELRDSLICNMYTKNNWSKTKIARTALVSIKMVKDILTAHHIPDRECKPKGSDMPPEMVQAITDFNAGISITKIVAVHKVTKNAVYTKIRQINGTPAPRKPPKHCLFCNSPIPKERRGKTTCTDVCSLKRQTQRFSDRTENQIKTSNDYQFLMREGHKLWHTQGRPPQDKISLADLLQWVSYNFPDFYAEKDTARLQRVITVIMVEMGYTLDRPSAIYHKNQPAITQAREGAAA